MVTATDRSDMPPKRRFRIVRALAVVAAAMLALALLLAVGAWWLSTQSALDLLLARAVARSDGRLEVEGATGSLLSTVHAERLIWRGDSVTLTATNVLFTWSPTDLLSRRFNVKGFGAQTLDVALKPTSGPVTMPASLALPLEVAIAQGGVGRITWHSTDPGNDSGGVVTGLKFSYAGGAREHRFADIELVSEWARVAGALTIGAQAPFTVSGALSLRGDGDLRDASADASVTGNLSALGMAARVSLRGASGDGSVRLAPFATVPIVSAQLKLADVDLQRFAVSLPSTRLDVGIDAVPIAGGFQGSLSATNAQSGSLDAGRVPVQDLHARVAWVGHDVDVSGLEATLAGGGRIAGDAHADLQQRGVRFDARVSGLNLSRIHGALVATALNGTVSGDASAARQSFRGDLRQGDLAFAFDAALAQRLLEVSSLRVQAAGGTLAARGRVQIDGTRAFHTEGTVRRLDPSRLARAPAGRVDADFKLDGVLEPAWRATGDVDVASGSVLAGTSISGHLHADASAHAWRNVQARVAVGGGELSVNGDAGTRGDHLALALQLPDLNKLRALATALAPAAMPPPAAEPVAGAVTAQASLEVTPDGVGGSIELHGKGLQWGRAYAAASIDANAAWPSTLMSRGSDEALRIALRGNGLRLATQTFASARIDASGSTRRHRIDASAAGEGIDARVVLQGGFAGSGSAASRVAWPWRGSIETLENRGDYALALRAPASLEASPSHVVVGGARLRVADGSADIDSFEWSEGRIASRGDASAIPVATLARLAGKSLPLRSTLTLRGHWAVSASPRLDGSVHVERESGDLYASGVETLDPARALGIEQATLDVRIDGDAVNATATLRSIRAGNADATMRLGAVPGAPPGRLSPQAPLSARIEAQVASLRPFQAWLGTAAAIDGRARLDVAASGTLAQPSLSGTVSADDLRIDLPQYGAQYRDGRLRARLAGDRIALDELSIAAGDGRFSAHGTLATTETSGVAPDVTWRAEHFRVLNRPDLRLVVGGEGTLRVVDARLLLAGRVNIEDGQVVYEPTVEGKLADDVVVAGRPPPPAARGAASVGDLPLRLDLVVETQSGVTFSGEGLQTRLQGRIQLTTSDTGTLEAKGRIAAVNGSYYALGQKLTIDRGALIFDGPVDNPALDVIALRKNLAVEAGLQITGTVKVPRVQLTSNPPVPDSEKLSWLISGQPLDRASRADLAALGAASASLIGGRGQKPITQTIANTFGLDDISVHSSSVNSVTGATSGQVVAFGKRLSDRLMLVYEQGLTIATNALRIEYTLTRTLTLRAEAGTVSSVGIYFRRNFD